MNAANFLNEFLNTRRRQIRFGALVRLTILRVNPERARELARNAARICACHSSKKTGISSATGVTWLRLGFLDLAPLSLRNLLTLPHRTSNLWYDNVEESFTMNGFPGEAKW